jgi:hypothetical protein
VLRELEHLEDRMSVLPGQRNIVLVSPGFLTLTMENNLSAVIDRAIRSKVIINTLDARGLYTGVADASVDASRSFPSSPGLMGQLQLLQTSQDQQSAEPLSSIADGTGGIYFHNSNDLVGGLKEAGNLPEAYYLLAFSPQPLKYDGRLHKLTIKLVAPNNHLRVQARKGYFAPAQAQDAAARQQEEIREAVFSQDNLSSIPIEVHTQFFKRGELDADLAVLTRLDLRFVAFQKQDGLNLNELTVVTALFDQNGNFITGKEKKITFRMRDATLARLAQTGLSMRTRFDVKPGTYLVREVVQDAEGAHLSGLTRTVEIPY